MKFIIIKLNWYQEGLCLIKGSQIRDLQMIGIPISLHDFNKKSVYVKIGVWF